MAQSSKIKNNITTVEDVMEMLNMLNTVRANMKMSLRFLANVKKISVSEIDSWTGKVVNTTTDNLVISQENEINRMNFMLNMKETVRSLNEMEMSLRDVTYTEV